MQTIDLKFSQISDCLRYRKSGTQGRPHTEVKWKPTPCDTCTNTPSPTNCPTASYLRLGLRKKKSLGNRSRCFWWAEFIKTEMEATSNQRPTHWTRKSALINTSDGGDGVLNLNISIANRLPSPSFLKRISSTPEVHSNYFDWQLMYAKSCHT
jgi:hypothetical protein